MLREIPEADWKILRRLHPLALERFCERVLGEVEQITHNRSQSAHQRYLNLSRIIGQSDRELARLFDDLRRSQALTMLVGIRSQGLLTDDELSALSSETRSAIEMLLDAG